MFFISSLNFSTNLNCCLVQHSVSYCLVRDLYSKSIKVISLYAHNQYTIPVSIALEEDIPSSAAAQATALQEKRNQHQPVIMDRPG